MLTVVARVQDVVQRVMEDNMNMRTALCLFLVLLDSGFEVMHQCLDMCAYAYMTSLATQFSCIKVGLKHKASHQLSQ